METNPIYNIQGLLSIGLDRIPQNSIIDINDSDGAGLTKMIKLISKTGIDSNTTVDTLLNTLTSNWIEIGGGGSSPTSTYTFVEPYGNGTTTGWRLISNQPEPNPTSGNGAIDLSIYDPLITTTQGAKGIQSFAVGSNVSATGDYASVFGSYSTASGNYSFATGYRTHASGIYSTAEGYSTSATTDSAHSEGSSTGAYGTGSHSEGVGSFAFGHSSHAEGSACEARGVSSHAEGRSTKANGVASHAEGDHTYATGYISHAEGNFCKATNQYTHAEGDFTYATGPTSHSEGIRTIAQNSASHAAGTYNIGTAVDTIHETGIGTGPNTRKNAFEIYTDGSLTAPEATPAIINARGTQSLVPVSYLLSAEFGNLLPVAPGAPGTLYVDINKFIRVS
jgi:hypothetical protein